MSRINSYYDKSALLDSHSNPKHKTLNTKYKTTNKSILALVLLGLTVAPLLTACQKKEVTPTVSMAPVNTPTPPPLSDAASRTTYGAYRVTEPPSLETIESLEAQSESYPNIKTILSQIKYYPSQLLDLAASKPETIDFVADYPKYIQDGGSTGKYNIDKDYTEGSIPLFIQWDKRWGYEMYGDDFMAVSGCGPTALSMVVIGLTGDTSLNPKAVADFSYHSGYLEGSYGTSWSLMTDGASQLGVSGRDIPLLAGTVKNALNDGHPIIATMKPGHFTTQGHFIVLTGITEDDKVILNDPDSIIRSNQPWDLDLILSESKNMWVFTAIDTPDDNE